ncbi:MAG: hypothetical protein HZA53_15745 [Planctomycetes bacterium]|nr:hypothetical protein [Planctomycetota bacterium]
MKPACTVALLALPFLASAWPARTERDGAPAQRSPTHPAELFPVPAAGLHVRGADDPKPSRPRQVLDEFSRCVGVTLHVESEADRLLGVQDALGLNRTLDVPPEEVWSFVEGFVSSLGLAFEFEHQDAPRVLRVLARSGVEGRELADHALLVDEADLGEWSRHPAWLLTLPLRLERARASDVDGDLRPVWSGLDPQRTEDVGEHLLLIVAFGDALARLARLARVCDVQAPIDR